MDLNININVFWKGCKGHRDSHLPLRTPRFNSCWRYLWLGRTCQRKQMAVFIRGKPVMDHALVTTIATPTRAVWLHFIMETVAKVVNLRRKTASKHLISSTKTPKKYTCDQKKSHLAHTHTHTHTHTQTQLALCWVSHSGFYTFYDHMTYRHISGKERKS